GDPARRMAGPDFARWRDGHVGARPATHARLGELLVIVGEDPDDLELRPETGRLPLDHLPSRRALALGRPERVAAVERPTVKLGVGELDPLGAERLGEPEQCLNLVD